MSYIAAFLLASFFQEPIQPKITAPAQVQAGELFIVELDDNKPEHDEGTWQFYPEPKEDELFLQEAIISGETKLLLRFHSAGQVLILYGYKDLENIEILVHPLQIGNPGPNPNPPLPVPPTPEFNLTSFVKSILPQGGPEIQKEQEKLRELFLKVVEAIDLGLVQNDDPEKVNSLTGELFKRGSFSAGWEDFMDKLAEKLSEISENAPIDHKTTWKEIADALK